MRNVAGADAGEKGPRHAAGRRAGSVILVWGAWLAAVVGLLGAGAASGVVEATDRPQGFLWPLFAWDFDLYAYVA